MRRLLFRIANLFRWNGADRELDRELSAHLTLLEDDFRRRGATAAEARRTARLALGGIEQTKELQRDARSLTWLGDACRDALVAARQLRQNSLFALTAVLILAVGIGLNLTVFQLLNVTALRPLPVVDPGTLVRFDRVSKFFSSNGVPYPATQFIRHNNSVLAAVLTSHSTDAVWEDDAMDRLRASYVSANWFEELGFPAQLGRLFAEAIDEQPDAGPGRRWSAMSSGGRASWVAPWLAASCGSTIVPRRSSVWRPPTVPGLQLEDPQVWLLIHQIDHFNPGMAFKEAWGSHNTQMYARLGAGVSAAAAREGLRATSQRVGAVFARGSSSPTKYFSPIRGGMDFAAPGSVASCRRWRSWPAA